MIGSLVALVGVRVTLFVRHRRWAQPSWKTGYGKAYWALVVLAIVSIVVFFVHCD